MADLSLNLRLKPSVALKPMSLMVRGLDLEKKIDCIG